MQKQLAVYTLLLLSFSLSFCQQSRMATTSSTQQGICGIVLWKEGNQMPGPDRPLSAGKPVRRTICIYQLTNLNQAKSESGFFRNLQTKLVKKVDSDAQGKFCAQLPEGRYSLLVQEEGLGLYANSFDGENNIFPITVEKGKVENITFTIDYKAAY